MSQNPVSKKKHTSRHLLGETLCQGEQGYIEPLVLPDLETMSIFCFIKS